MMRWAGRLMLLWLIGFGGVAGADQIKLKDGTELTATLLQQDGESVIVELSRSSIATVNGQPLPPPVIAGEPAPDFTATDLSGTPQGLSANRGSVTLLQFWASWCPHCRSDVPLMKTLGRRYQEKGLRLVTVSVDQDLEKLTAFIKKERLTYPVISATSAPSLPALYEMQGIPAYFLIGRDGTIVKTWYGSVTERKSDFEAILARTLESPS